MYISRRLGTVADLNGPVVGCPTAVYDISQERIPPQAVVFITTATAIHYLFISPSRLSLPLSAGQ